MIFYVVIFFKIAIAILMLQVNHGLCPFPSWLLGK